MSDSCSNDVFCFLNHMLNDSFEKHHIAQKIQLPFLQINNRYNVSEIEMQRAAPLGRDPNQHPSK